MPGSLRALATATIALVAGAGLSACGSSARPASSAAGAATASTPSSTAPSSTTTAASASGSCTASSGPSGPHTLPCPTLTLDPSRRYTVKLLTSLGEIDIALAARQSPHTDASVASLVRRGFYDGLIFHRVAAGFVIQGGDPRGTGDGGPGYQVVEPPPSNLRYTPGVVAMAKTAQDPPGASGSQFFIVIGSSSPLPPEYAYVGTVSRGLAVAQRIGRLPTDPPGDGRPLRPPVIRRAALQVGR